MSSEGRADAEINAREPYLCGMINRYVGDRECITARGEEKILIIPSLSN